MAQRGGNAIEMVINDGEVWPLHGRNGVEEHSMCPDSWLASGSLQLVHKLLFLSLCLWLQSGEEILSQGRQVVPQEKPKEAYLNLALL